MVIVNQSVMLQKKIIIHKCPIRREMEKKFRHEMAVLSSSGGFDGIYSQLNIFHNTYESHHIPKENLEILL